MRKRRRGRNQAFAERLFGRAGRVRATRVFMVLVVASCVTEPQILLWSTGSSSLAWAGSPPVGACCDMVLTENRACVGGFADGAACDTDADCRVCGAGTNQGLPCTDKNECPDASCPEPSATLCVGDAVCREVEEKDCPLPSPWVEGGRCEPICSGGVNKGESCEDSNDCPPSCEGGMADGEVCISDANCPGVCVGIGILLGFPCLVASDCIFFPGDQLTCDDVGSCGVSGQCSGSFCIGGANDGLGCSREADCPDGACPPGPFPVTCGLAACCIGGDQCLNLTQRECLTLETEPELRAFYPGLFCTGNDCQANGTPDACDIGAGASLDCSRNVIPDECEPDCNENGEADSCDILEGRSEDCDDNVVPDECQVDCNGDGVIDACEPLVTSVLLEEDFENGLPPDWAASGLWSVTDTCSDAEACNPVHSAYFGYEYVCALFGDHVEGVLASSEIAIPANAIDATLTYCSSFDVCGGSCLQTCFANLTINGVVIDDVGAEEFFFTHWETRTVDLSSFAGTTVRLSWNLLAEVAEGSTCNWIDDGWLIDDVRLTVVQTPFVDCNGNKLADACETDCDGNGVPDDCDLVSKQLWWIGGTPAASIALGADIATNGEYVLLGRPFAEGVGVERGAVDVYRIVDSVVGRVARLTASDGADQEYFGLSVAVEGNLSLVGSRATDTVLGSAHVFRLVEGQWIEEARLNSRDGSVADGFGFALGVSGDVIAVGAPNDDEGIGTDAGAVYIFRLVDGRWEQESKIVAPDGAASDNFGFSLVIEGGTLVVGSPGTTTGGAVYVFRFNETQWDFETVLQGVGRFGASVDMDADRMIVAAPEETGSNDELGASHIYRFTDKSWELEASLRQDAAVSTAFGSSVSIDKDIAVVGGFGFDNELVDPMGHAYVFRLVAGMWVFDEPLPASEVGGSGDMRVAISANLLATSNHRPEFHDSAFIFRLATQIDSDGDGIPNDCDNCVEHVNPNQDDCDNNGVGDICQIVSCAPDDSTCIDCDGNDVPDQCHRGDTDDDDRIGLTDHADFARCMTGPCGGIPCPLPPGAPPCCTILDFNGDGAIDLADSAALQREFGAQ